MKLIIDISRTKEDVHSEIDEQIKEWQRTGLLPVNSKRYDSDLIPLFCDENIDCCDDF